MRRIRVFLVAVTMLVLAGMGSAQNRGGLGAPCEPGQLLFGGYLLMCSDAGVFRYALHEDIPPAPEGGYVERPAWYPRLSEVLRPTNPPACPTSGRVTFTSPVIRLEDLLPIVPQGIMVTDHVTPIDHGYIGVKPLAKARTSRTEADFVPITAPADGEVIEVSLLGSPTSIRIVLAHGCETYSILMVVNRVSGALAYLHDDLMAQRQLRPDVRVLAGEELGEQRDNPLDFSVHDGAAWLSGFVAPFSYTSAEAWKPYTVNPWPYFTPELAAAYEQKMQRRAEPRWGRIDQDVRGAASGNWFLAGTMGYSGHSVEAFRAGQPLRGGMVDGKLAYSWSHLALARHAVDPGRWIMSIGWWQDPRGDTAQWLLEVGSGQPDPSQLRAASGIVVYKLWSSIYSPAAINDAPPATYQIVPVAVRGIIAIQVVDEETMNVELMPGTQDPSGFRGFTSAKRLYRR